ncbi:MAG TPA: amylo-alpha-1,6-glucosidase [Tepidisphaeraceae bacterium]|nr:amylo-alpha-1,6-glucosidase [Tepidisphaeraceae bacterium]
MDPLQVGGMPLDALLEREWLITNGIGGYACSTAVGMNTRKYHGVLVAAMTPPVGRMVLLSRLEETLHLKGWPHALACNEYPGTIYPEGHRLLKAFCAGPYPRWAYQGDGWTLEKSVRLVRGENTVVVSYTLLGADCPAELDVRPLLALRSMHDLMYQWNGRLAAENKSKRHHRIPPTLRTPEVFFAHDGTFSATPACWYLNTIYRREEQRGYSGLEDLWNPGVVRWRLSPGQTVHFVCSADPIQMERTLQKLGAQDARPASVSEIVSQPDATQELLVASARAYACDTLETDQASMPLLTGFPWSSPSVRDALTAFVGMFLVTKNFAGAKALLQSLASKLNRGLLPSALPENGSEAVYGGADVSLWFINSLWQYLRYTGDEQTVSRLLDAVQEIVTEYRRGTLLGVQTDADGLLKTHAAGMGTTWMDAKIGDWVVTPRAGRPVELNALWYNALRIAAELFERFGRTTQASDLGELGSKTAASFNRRFWNPERGCCYDAVDDHGTDPSVRPNQLLAISLPFPVLASERHPAVLEKVHRSLLTPFGLRTLSPEELAYHGRYTGDVVSRDRALHQGCVFPWLLGHWVSAYLRVLGRAATTRREALRFLQPCIEHMQGPGLGHLCELFDGDAPHRPGGAIASAASVGELLRAYVEDILDQAPAALPTPAKIPQSAPSDSAITAS